MNTITAKNSTSKYSKEDEHLNIFIDEISLDEFVDEKQPDNDFKGLVPSLLFWLDDIRERKLVWERILPAQGQITNAPVLMCPDDVDLCCTLIIAETERKTDRVIWHRIGIDKTHYGVPNYLSEVGKDVKWFDNIKPMEFSFEQYSSMLNEFQKLIIIDDGKQKIWEWIFRITQESKSKHRKLAFNFGIFETAEGYKIYLTGSKLYDSDDDDWVCQVDYEPVEKYLDISEFTKGKNWQTVLEIVCDAVRRVIKVDNSNKSFLLNAVAVTAGFDDGDLIKIK